MRISKQQAIETLIKLGRQDAADKLDKWRSKVNNNSGWDRFLEVNYPELFKFFWPTKFYRKQKGENK